MNASLDGTSARGHVVRARRRDVDCAALGETDRRLLAVLCAHRVVRQDQLERLFPDIPERTLRYRTRRLHDLGLMGRTRPYRERGSAPNHHWPTRRADCLTSGEPIPRGGERHRPNPLFLAHAAALTELYVTLAVEASAVGFSLVDYRREADAREPFEHLGKERVLAPDALVILADEQERKLGAFVELDLGTMSHARLRQKADLYLAYALADAWHGRHPFLPALLFLTTSDVRARRFLTALGRALAHGPQTYGRRTLVAGAGALAFTPRRLLRGTCLGHLDGDELATLRDVLNAARTPYDEKLAERRREREADDERCRVLREDPVAMRAHLSKVEHNLGSYMKALGSLGEQTVRLLVASEDSPIPEERRVLSAMARRPGRDTPPTWATKQPSITGRVNDRCRSPAHRALPHRPKPAGPSARRPAWRRAAAAQSARAPTRGRAARLARDLPAPARCRARREGAGGAAPAEGRLPGMARWRRTAVRTPLRSCRAAHSLQGGVLPPARPQTHQDLPRVPGAHLPTTRRRTRRCQDRQAGGLPLLWWRPVRHTATHRKDGIAMSSPHEHPNGGRRGRQAGSRRPGQPSAPTRRAQRRATIICRQERRLPNPDHEAFVAWFVAYWRRHGAQLFADQTTNGGE